MSPQYKTVDYRAVVRCGSCGAWLESRDKGKHTHWHRMVAALYENNSPAEVQATLPPF